MTTLLSTKQTARTLQKIPFVVDLMGKLWRLSRPRYTAGAVGIVFDDAGRLLIVEHVYHARTPWGLPGGYLNRREDPAQAVARELREELELVVEVGPIVAVDRSYVTHLDFAFLCRAQGSIGKLCSELISYRWVPVSDLPPLLAFHRRAIDQAVKLSPVYRWT